MSPPFVYARHDRVRSLDWARGLCVLLMIQTHARVLLRPELRTGALYRWIDWMDGLVAPTFLLVAGFALAFQMTRGPPELETAVARKNLWRIAEIAGVACWVNAMWFSLLREPERLFRMDILHAIATGLILCMALQWPLASKGGRLARAPTHLLLGFACLGIAPWFAELDGPWAHLLNKQTGSLFPLTPWVGYVLLGAPVGMAAARGGLPAVRRALGGLSLLGLALWAAEPWLRFYPPHPYYEFHPSYHGLRLSAVCAALWMAVRTEQLTRAQSDSAIWGGLARGLERVSALALPSYFLHLAILHYSIGGVSLAGLWAARGGWGAYGMLTSLLALVTFVLAARWKAALARLRALPARAVWGRVVHSSSSVGP